MLFYFRKMKETPISLCEKGFLLEVNIQLLKQRTIIELMDCLLGAV